MINLLPPEEKEKLLLEKKKRIVIILWFLLLFFLICLILILFALEIYLKARLDIQKTLLVEAKREFGQSEVQGLQEEIQSTNSTLEKLNSFYQKKIYFTEILERISRTLPQGVYLTNFSTVFSSDTFKVSLSGFAQTREILLGFKKNLEGEQEFEKVSFLPSNWVKPNNIDFFITFEIKHAQ